MVASMFSEAQGSGVLVIVAVGMVVAVGIVVGVTSAGAQLLNNNAITVMTEKMMMLLVALVFFMEGSLSSKGLRDGLETIPQ